MAELTIRITELPGADPLSGIELIPLVQGGVTKTRSASDLVYESGLQAHIDAVDPHPQYTTQQEASDAAPIQSVDGRLGAVVLNDLYEPRRKNNLNATTDPTVNDDSSLDYEPLSRWVNNSTGEFFVCTIDTVGSANWQKASLTLDELGALALSSDASGVPIDDSGNNYSATNVEGALAEEADARQSHEARQDNPHNVTYTQTGGEQLGVAQNIMDTHESALDPHPQYTTDLEATTIAVNNSITFAIALG